MKSLIVFGLVTAVAMPARADVPTGPQASGPNEMLNPTSIVEGAGIKVGEGTVLHPIAGIETGIVSNVFYEEAGTNASGLLRVLIELQAGTLSPERMAITNAAATAPGEQSQEKGDFQYDFRAYLSWEQYLSTNDNVQEQGGVGGGLLWRGIVKPSKPLNFSFMEHFNRVIRATNFESSDDTNRDINTFNVRLSYEPRGRTLGGYLYYQNVLDLFEDEDQRFANRFQNTFGLRVSWRWLPLTRIYGEVSQGVFTGIGASTKVTSYPLTAVAGVMTSLTLRTTLNARVGYTRGFYSSGPDYGTVVGGIQLGYRYSPLGRVTAMYSYDHQDSINANFYRDHTLQVTLEQLFAPFTLFVRPELHFRRYEGITAVMGSSPNRDDLIAAVTFGGRYMFRGWLAATLDYSLASVQTEFRYMVDGTTDDPSYTRHQLLAGLRAAY